MDIKSALNRDDVRQLSEDNIEEVFEKYIKWFDKNAFEYINDREGYVYLRRYKIWDAVFWYKDNEELREYILELLGYGYDVERRYIYRQSLIRRVFRKKPLKYLYSGKWTKAYKMFIKKVKKDLGDGELKRDKNGRNGGLSGCYCKENICIGFFYTYLEEFYFLTLVERRRKSFEDIDKILRKESDNKKLKK